MPADKGTRENYTAFKWCRHALWTVLLSLQGLCAFSQTGYSFQKYYDTALDEYGVGGAFMGTGSALSKYLVVGTQNVDATHWKGILIEVDSIGNIIWSKTYNTTETCTGTYYLWAFSDAMVSSDSKYYYVAGQGLIYFNAPLAACGAGSGRAAEAIVMKIDTAGAVQWTTGIGTILAVPTATYKQSALHVEYATDGNLLVTGYVQYTASDYDIFLAKMYPDGTPRKIYSYKFGASNTKTDMGYWVMENTTGEYVIAGITDSYASGDANNDVFLMGIDSSTFAVNWAYTYRSGQIDGEVFPNTYPYISNASVSQIAAGQYLLGSISKGRAGTDYDGLLMDVSANATSTTVNASKYYGDNSYDQYGLNAYKVTGGSYILATIGKSSVASTKLKPNMGKINSALSSITWQHSYLDDANTTVSAGVEVKELADGGFILASTTTAGAGNRAAAFVRTYSDGTVLSGGAECAIDNTSYALTAATITASAEIKASVTATARNTSGTDYHTGVIAPTVAAMAATKSTSCESSSLPVELLSFTGKNKSFVNILSWTTASEVNNEYFTVERSEDGLRYLPIGRVAGAGNSDIEQQYRFTDTSPEEGVSYYRLKQTDYDGHSEYFDPIAIKCCNESSDATLSVYPNPSDTRRVHLLLKSEAGEEARIRIFSLVGQEIVSAAVQKENGQFFYATDLPSGLPAGLYMVEVQDATQTFREKLIVR